MSGPGSLGPAVRALHYWEQRQQVMANNLANVSTPGFKGERVFARLLDDGGPVAQTVDDFRGGAMSETGRSLDVALDGDGFMVVKTDAGERYVRGGSFRLDEAGVLVTADGAQVMGEGGPLVLPPGQVAITDDGTVQVDGAALGRLRIERPTAPPLREGTNRWTPQGDGEALSPGAYRVQQGHLEESNVDPVSALVEMIEIQRAYAAVQKSIQTTDGVMQTISMDLGRVGG